MKQNFIVIDGKTYKSADEMPEDIRAKYEEAMRSLDNNHNNMPDVFENSAPQVALPNMMSAAKILVNGQTYDRLDQLPPEIRTQYEQAMGVMDANRNGIPDFVEGILNLPAQMTGNNAMSVGTSAPQPVQSFGTVQSKPQIATSTIEPVSSGGWLLALTGIALLVLCLVAGAAGIWYFFLR